MTPQQIIDEVEKIHAAMTPLERLDFWSQIIGEYCRECGDYDPNHLCHCCNDE